jgi:Ca-activated chloride channel family protein
MRSLSIALSLGIAAATTQPPAFRSGVDAVRIDVQVLRAGRPVPNLTAADFELLDSGVRQRIDVVSLEQQPVDVLFAFDISASMTGDPLSRLKDAAHAAVSVLANDDRAALLTFSHALLLRTGWTLDRRRIANAIDSAVADGATALQDAAFAACALRERARGRMLVLLFSDGMDTISWLPAVRVLDQARRSDLVFDAVSLPAEHPRPTGVVVAPAPPQPPEAVLKRWFLEEPVLFRQRFLHVLADETGGDFIVAQTPNLRDTFVRVVSLFKSRYVLSYIPRGVPETGWHSVDVRLKRGAADIRARPGYQR